MIKICYFFSLHCIIRDMVRTLRRWWRSQVYILPDGDVTYVAGESGSLVRIPSRILVEVPSYRVVAFGHDAREVEHAGFGQSQVIWPYTSREILDDTGAEVLIRALMSSTLGSRFLLKPQVIVAIPSDLTPFMSELWQHVVYAGGARSVVTIDPLLAVAQGAGVPGESSHGYAVAVVDQQSIRLGIVAFHHVQFPHVHSLLRHDGRVQDWQEVFAQVWNEWLPTIPLEYATTLQQEGCLVAAEETNTKLAQSVSRAMGSPVVFVPRSMAIVGMRQLEQLV